MKRIYFIVNLHAKNGRCKKTWRIIETELKVNKVLYEAFYTEYPGHAGILADKIGMQAESNTTFITVVGGDGTLHEVVNGAAAYSNVALGFIPAGSGNDFSRGFGIPKHPRKALFLLLKNVEENKIQSIDIGRMSTPGGKEIYFMNNMGAGFDAVVAKDSNESMMKSLLNRFSLGRLVYVYILLKKLFTYNCTDMDIWIDERKHKFQKVWFVTISNQEYYGGGMRIAPQAVPTDGLLDITVVHNLSRFKLLCLFYCILGRAHKI